MLPLILATLFVASCATGLPPLISEPAADDPGLLAAQKEGDAYVGRQVRWGGTIATIENKESETWVEIVARALRRYGQPYESDKSIGRFIARVNGFLDPAIFSAGRQITISGKLEKSVIRPIGEFTYLYPVVDVDSYYLWETPKDIVIYEPMPPWHYDPWLGYPYFYRHPLWR